MYWGALIVAEPIASVFNSNITWSFCAGIRGLNAADVDRKINKTTLIRQEHIVREEKKETRLRSTQSILLIT